MTRDTSLAAKEHEFPSAPGNDRPNPADADGHAAWKKAPASPHQYFGVLLVVTLATVPFLDKAFHIDDILYLHGAYQILSGHDAHHGQVLWDAPEGQPAPLFEIDFNPPLWKYLLAGTIFFWANDRAEWKLHLLESAFVLIAGFGVFSLARRYCGYPVWVVAMVLWGPFFLPGQNLMLEGPLLALAAWSVEFQCRSWETGRVRWSWLAGLLAALAVLTKYTGGMLLPLYFLGSILACQPRSLVVLIPPVLALSIHFGHDVILYQQSHMASHGVFFDVARWPIRLLRTVRALGSVFVLGPVLAIQLTRRGWRGAALLALITGIATALSAVDLAWIRELSRLEGWSPFVSQQAHIFAFSLNGWISLLALLYWAMVNLHRGAMRWRPMDPRAFLLLWALLLFLFNVTSVPFQATRHLLLLLVPVFLLVAAWMGDMGLGGRWRACLLFVSTLLGFSLASADYEIAGTYRELANTTVRKWVSTGRNVWFTGNWGFVYYATRQGARPLVERPEQFGMPPIRTGDIVVNPRVISYQAFPPHGFPPLIAIEHVQPQAWNVFRTLAPATHYYSVQNSNPWQVLIERPRADVSPSLFVLPPLEDVLILEIGEPGTNLPNP